MNRLTLTAVKPTGELHLGNYLGAIRPIVELAADRTRDVYVFVADVHALNLRQDPAQAARRSRQLAAALIACGLDPEKAPNVRVFRQSRICEITSIAQTLGAVCPKGLLNRAHAYKAAVAANADAGRDRDHGVSAGLYTYPLLMAADILTFGGRDVPVGADQAQHLEIAADLAQAFNRAYGPVLTVPEALIRDDVHVPGLDGRKMSKSYDNTIEMFADPAAQAKKIKRIVTDSLRPQDSKDPAQCTVATLISLLDPAAGQDVACAYRHGEMSYGHAKQLLVEQVDRTVSPFRVRYEQLLADPSTLDEILADGERQARTVAQANYNRIMDATGM